MVPTRTAERGRFSGNGSDRPDRRSHDRNVIPGVLLPAAVVVSCNHLHSKPALVRPRGWEPEVEILTTGTLLSCSTFHRPPARARSSFPCALPHAVRLQAALTPRAHIETG